MNREQMAALKSEWEAGNVSDVVLCRKYQITPGKLARWVVNEGWVRRKPPTEKAVLDTVHLFSFDPEEQATLSAANIVAIHRKDVAKLRSIAGTLVERLGHLLGGTPLPEGQMCLGSRESPADLLEKLSRVMVRTTEIERQAYGLKTFSPEAEATDAQLQEELDSLTDRLNDIAEQKASVHQE